RRVTSRASVPRSLGPRARFPAPLATRLRATLRRTRRTRASAWLRPLRPVVAYAKVGELGAGDDRDAGDRYEEYEVPVSPLTGETVKVRRNMETGLSVRIEGEADQGPHA